MANTHTLDPLFAIKRDLYCFHLTSSGTTIVYWEIVPRLIWLSSLLHRVMEKMRKRVNWVMAKFIPFLGGFAYQHVDLEGGIPGVYRQEGVHLSDVGADIFNLGLQYSIEMAAYVE